MLLNANRHTKEYVGQYINYHAYLIQRVWFFEYLNLQMIYLHINNSNINIFYRSIAQCQVRSWRHYGYIVEELFTSISEDINYNQCIGDTIL